MNKALLTFRQIEEGAKRLRRQRPPTTTDTSEGLHGTQESPTQLFRDRIQVYILISEFGRDSEALAMLVVLV